MNNFNEIFEDRIVSFLNKNGIEMPTDVQSKAIPLILQGKNVVCQSPTGTGKTYAYLLPMLKLIDKSIKTPQVLILTPTHELAVQINKVAKEICKELELTVPSLLIGGTNLKKQIESLKNKPSIIIGTPGRVAELHNAKRLKLHTVSNLVLDEGDRLIDKNNRDNTNVVIKKLMRDTHKHIFSASMKDEALVTIKTLIPDASYVNIGDQYEIPENIEHLYFETDYRKKLEEVRKIFSSEEIQKAIIFINKEDDIENMEKRLNFHKIPCKALFGKCKDFERKEALNDLATGKIKAIVASDLASRGLDLPDLDYIINLSIPEDPILYQHRVGRTGRAGKKGTAISIAEPSEIKTLKKFEKVFNIKINKCEMSYGKIVTLDK